MEWAGRVRQPEKGAAAAGLHHTNQPGDYSGVALHRVQFVASCPAGPGHAAIWRDRGSSVAVDHAYAFQYFSSGGIASVIGV